MNSWLVIIISVLILLFFVIPKLYRRKIESVFLNANSDVVYVLTNAKSTTLAKGGAIDNYRVYFNKVDLITGQLIFKTKIKSFTTKMLEGYVKVVGIGDTHSFLIMSGDRLYVVDNATGKIVLNHRQLIKKFPVLKKFKVETIEFNQQLQTIIIYDSAGYANSLNLPDFTLELFKESTKKKKEEIPKNGFVELETYGKAELFLPDTNDMFPEEWRFSMSDERTIMSIDSPSGKRKFMAYAIPNEVDEKSIWANDFLYPQIIESGRESNKLINEKFLVLHFSNDHDQAKDMMVSLVEDNSKIVWTKKVSEIVFNPKSSEDAIVCYEIINYKFYFFSYVTDTNSNRLSFSVLDFATGMIVEKPKEIKF